MKELVEIMIHYAGCMPLGIWMGINIMKKVDRKRVVFKDELLPYYAIILGIILFLFFPPVGKAFHKISVRIFYGITYGSTAIGIDQLIKQTWIFIFHQKNKEYLSMRKRKRIVNIGD